MKRSFILFCLAGLLGTSGVLTQSAQAQRVVDVTPGVNGADVSADALISGVFDADSGTVETGSVQVFIDDQDVTSSSAITRNFFSYRPTQPLSPGQHEVRVEYSNTQGQRRVARWRFTVQNPAPALAIATVTHNATEPLAQDATLLTTINGTPGADASVLLIENGDAVREIQAEEVSSGIYVASYSLTASDVSGETIAIGQLQRGDQKIFAAASQPVIITASTSNPEVTDVEVSDDSSTTVEDVADDAMVSDIALQPEFTSHSDGDQIATSGVSANS